MLDGTGAMTMRKVHCTVMENDCPATARMVQQCAKMLMAKNCRTDQTAWRRVGQIDVETQTAGVEVMFEERDDMVGDRVQGVDE